MKLTFGQLFDFGTWTAQIWLLHQSVRSEKKIQKFRSNFQRILFARQSCFRRPTFSRNNSLSKYCLFTGPHLGSGYSKIEFWPTTKSFSILLFEKLWPMTKSFSILLFDLRKVNFYTEFWKKTDIRLVIASKLWYLIVMQDPVFIINSAFENFI